MISRSTLIAALVAVELAIIGMAAQAVSARSTTHWTFGPAWSFHTATVTKHLAKTFETGPSPHVVLDVDRADVTIQAGAATTVQVAGTMRVTGRPKGVEPDLTAVRTEDGVRIAAEAGLVRFSRIAREVHVIVPPGAHVEVLSAGDVSANGLREKIVAHLGSGSIRVANHRGDVDVSTTGGDIDLLDVQAGSIAVRSGDGALKLAAAGAEHLDARTASGAIAATNLRAVDGTMQSGDGSIEVAFARDSDSTVDVHSADGQVSGIPAAPFAANAAGSIKLGSGRGHFAVSTDSGSIAVFHGAVK